MGRVSFICFILAAASPLARCQPGSDQTAGELTLSFSRPHFGLGLPTVLLVFTYLQKSLL